MAKREVFKAVIVYVAVFAAITLVWNIALRVIILPRSFTRTNATVISITTQAPSIRGGGRQVNHFPTYAYTDDKGNERIFESRDGFNGINSFLFRKNVGDSVVAYYENGSKEGLWITQTGDWYTFILAPLVFAVFPIGVIFVLVLLTRQKRKQLHQ